MRNTIGKLLVILSVLILLFSAAFQTVSLILRDTGYIEKKYRELNVGENMEQKMSTPDLSGATEALLAYMRGERPNIKYPARVNGVDMKDVFYHEKEIVHMAEVQSLWLGLDGFSRYGAIVAGAMLIAGIILPEKGKRRAVLANGMFWACGIFGGVMVFFGIWALLDFSSFWTVFHFLIFPASLFQFLSGGASQEALNELNWMLPSDSIMVHMLTPIFPSLVLRCALAAAAEIGVVLLAAVVIRFAWRRAEKKPAPLADVVVIEHDANEPVPIEGPDLVLAHKLRNAPVSVREELLRRAQNGEPLEDEPESTEEHLISQHPLPASPQGEASKKEGTDEPSPRGHRSERPQCGEERGEVRPKQGVEEAQRRATTMFRDGEGGSRSETDEVSEPEQPEEHLISQHPLPASPQGEASKKEGTEEPSPRGHRSERPQCGEERGEVRPKQGVEEAQRRATTMFRDGEGGSHSETDEASEPEPPEEQA